MKPEIKIQKDYYLTEVSIGLPTDIGQLGEILKATKASAKLVILYNQGSVLGVNIEQRTKISEVKAAEIRPLLEIGEKIL
jgi:hypothetical protein